MKRVIALLLALLTLAVMLISCADEQEQPADTTVASGDNNPQDSETEAGGTEPSNVDANGYLLDNLPENLNLKTEVTMLYWSDVEQPEFFVDDQTGEIVNDAIYNRNLNTEARLGVTLKFIPTLGNYQNQANFVKEALNSINSGGDYDIFAGYSMTGATLAVNGYAQNLRALEYLDFDMPWWPDSLIGQATINDKLYFASGDISPNMLHMMYVMFFNKQLITDYNLEDPYALVDNGDWTYTKMIEMCTGVYNDADGSGKSDQNDKFGFCTASIHFDSFFTGAGLNTIEKTSDDMLIISPSFNSEKTISLLEGLCSFMWDSGNAYYGATGAVFALGNTIFTLDRSYMGLLRKEEITFEYGIVPVPKFDTAQENYYTCLGFPYTMYAISSASKHPDAAAAVLECLCSEGYRLVTPMLFETSMKYKYSSDNDSARMYDIIRAGVSIDIGRIFTTELNNYSYSLFRDACVNNSASSWSRVYTAAAKVMGKKLEGINSSLSALD